MSYEPYEYLPELPELTVTSPEFEDGAPLPSAALDPSVGGEGRSPELHWEGAPEGTKSFVVTCFDPDAPTASGFWHWAVANIPASAASIPGGVSSEEDLRRVLGSDAVVVLRNDAHQPNYLGACPPEGHGEHRYLFAVHAVSEPKLDVRKDHNTCANLGFQLFSTGLARGVLMGRFGR